jgi:hypothetical protein
MVSVQSFCFAVLLVLACVAAGFLGGWGSEAGVC